MRCERVVSLFCYLHVFGDMSGNFKENLPLANTRRDVAFCTLRIPGVSCEAPGRRAEVERRGRASFAAHFGGLEARAEGRGRRSLALLAHAFIGGTRCGPGRAGQDGGTAAASGVVNTLVPIGH